MTYHIKKSSNDDADIILNFNKELAKKGFKFSLPSILQTSRCPGSQLKLRLHVIEDRMLMTLNARRILDGTKLEII